MNSTSSPSPRLLRNAASPPRIYQLISPTQKPQYYLDTEQKQLCKIFRQPLSTPEHFPYENKVGYIAEKVKSARLYLTTAVSKATIRQMRTLKSFNLIQKV